jgi:hypothetical protein
MSWAPHASSVSEFARLCAQVRFSEDAPEPESSGPRGDLARLLGRVRSDSLLVTHTTAPQVWRTVKNVSERLGLEDLPEVYIRADSEMNAFVPLAGGSERPVAVLNSGLVSLLSPAELAFPLGHELGHLGLGHTHGFVGDSDLSGLAALSAMYRSRAAELSADRVGLVACGSTFAAANAILKTASGLRTDLLGLDVAAFVSQADRLPGEMSREWELALTHPSLPFRMWALLRFGHSDAHVELSGSGGDAAPLAEIDAEVSMQLEQMGEGRLATLEAEAIQRAVLWLGSLRVAGSRLSEGVLYGVVGAERARRALEFGATQGIEQLERKATEALAALDGCRPSVRERLDKALAPLGGAGSGGAAALQRQAEPA